MTVDVASLDMSPVRAFRRVWRRRLPAVVYTPPVVSEELPEALPLSGDEAERALGGVPGCSCADCVAIRERLDTGRGSYDLGGEPQVTLGKCITGYTKLVTHGRSDADWLMPINRSVLAYTLLCPYEGQAHG